MAKLHWTVELEGQPKRTGTAEAAGVVRIRCDAPEGILKSVTASMEFPLAPAEKAFFNGYQSWSWCPEVTPDELQILYDELEKREEWEKLESFDK